jgi:hypothetical protein
MAGSYVRFTEIEVRTKTKRWEVTSTSGNRLGQIRFYPQWRCYVFEPDPVTVYNAGCMSDISDFIASQTVAWREGLRVKS